MRTIWKLRLVIIAVALVLIAGGAIAAAAKEGVFSSTPTPSADVATQQNSEPTATQGTEPTPTQGTEPTATQGTEPTQIPHVNKPGVITTIDCANNTITITVDGSGDPFTATLTSNTVYTLTGKPGACTDLKTGEHVVIEAQQLSAGVWTAEKVAEDDGNGGSAGGNGGGDAPTPTPNH